MRAKPQGHLELHTRQRKPQWEAAEMGQSSQSGEGVDGRQSMGQRSKGSEVSANFPCVQGTGIAWGQGWGTSSVVQQDCAVPHPRSQATQVQTLGQVPGWVSHCHSVPTAPSSLPSQGWYPLLTYQLSSAVYDLTLLPREGLKFSAL